MNRVPWPAAAGVSAASSRVLAPEAERRQGEGDRPRSRGDRFSGSVWKGLVAGLLGGLVAAGVMSAVHGAVSKPTGDNQRATPEQQEGDDATVRVASAVTRMMTGSDVPPHKQKIAGSIVHYAFGATMGAAYGAVAEVLPRIAVGGGVPFGAAVWLGAHVVVVPTLGLADPPTRRPRSAEALELGLHLLYGLTTDVVRRLVRARL